MDNNTGNQGNQTAQQEGNPAEQGNANGNGSQSEHLFTQAEVNALINKRYAEIKSKYEDYDELKEKAKKFDEAEEASKTELQKATEKANALQAKLDKLEAEETARGIREKVAKEKGIPAHLLKGNTEEECNAQADELLAYMNPQGYPDVPDAGEVHHQGKRSTEDQFADAMKGIL